jgi:hypothetical protein
VQRRDGHGRPEPFLSSPGYEKTPVATVHFPGGSFLIREKSLDPLSSALGLQEEAARVRIVQPQIQRCHCNRRRVRLRRCSMMMLRTSWRIGWVQLRDNTAWVHGRLARPTVTCWPRFPIIELPVRRRAEDYPPPIL